MILCLELIVFFSYILFTCYSYIYFIQNYKFHLEMEFAPDCNYQGQEPVFILIWTPVELSNTKIAMPYNGSFAWPNTEQGLLNLDDSF